MLFDLRTDMTAFMTEKYKEIFILMIYEPIDFEIKNLILKSNENEVLKMEKLKNICNFSWEDKKKYME